MYLNIILKKIISKNSIFRLAIKIYFTSQRSLLILLFTNIVMCQVMIININLNDAYQAMAWRCYVRKGPHIRHCLVDHAIKDCRLYNSGKKKRAWPAYIIVFILTEIFRIQPFHLALEGGLRLCLALT